MFSSKKSDSRLVPGLRTRRDRPQAKSSARRRLRRLVIEGLETRNLLAQISISSMTDWDKYVKDGAYQVGGNHDDVIVYANIDTTKNITLHGKSITIHDGVQIVSDGKIKIEAEKKLTTLGINAINQLEDLFASNLNATITIGDSVVIQGDKVEISAESGNPRLWEDSAAANALNQLLHKVFAIYLEAKEVPDLFSLPLTFQMWKPESTITIGTTDATLDNASKIIGTREVTITSDAEANAIGKAIANGSFKIKDEYKDATGKYNLKFKYAIAAGLFITDAAATIEMHNAIVSSSSDVTVTTNVDNAIELETKALKNTGLSTTRPDGFSVSLAWSEQKTTSTILVDKDSLISSSGNVSIEASAKNDNSTSSAAAVYRDGVAGIAPAILDGCGIFQTDNGCNPETSPATNVSVQVDGQVTSLYTPAAKSPTTSNLSFNPSFVADIANSKVTLSGIAELKTGDPVQITSDHFGTIPGLVRGQTYYVIVTQNSGSNPTYDLRFAATAGDALQNNHLSFGNAYPTLTNLRTGQSVPVTQTATDKEQRSLLLFTFDTGPDGTTPIFQDGDQVQFRASAGRFLGFTDAVGKIVPLTDQALYPIKIIESKSKAYPLTIQLLDQANTPLAIYGGAFLQSESGHRYPISDINNQNGQVDLRKQQLSSSDETVTSVPPLIPVVQGQKLFFHDGLQESSASLEDGTAYWAIVDPNNSGVIQLAISPAQAEAANPSVQEALAHLSADFKGLHIPLTTDGKPDGLDENQTFSITLGSTTKTFVFTSSGNLSGNGPSGTFAVKLDTTSAETQATEIVNAIVKADIGLQPSYEGNGRIAIGTPTNLSLQSSSALQIATVSVDIPIGNFESGVGLVFESDPRLVDQLRVTYHAVPGKPMGGLVDGGAYTVYNVNNSNYNPAVPQYILTLMNAAQISSLANSGSFALTITAPNGSQKTTASIAWNASATDIENAINALALTGVSVQVTGSGKDSTPWVIEGLSTNAVTAAGSNLTHDGLPVGLHITEAAPNIVMGSSADEGTFTLRVADATGSEGVTGDLAWNSTAAQLQAAIAALNLAGLSITVEGSGSLQDPWRIHGLNPSQVVVDSGKLLRGTDLATMQMTSARQVQFGYGQYLEDASGNRYLVTGADLDGGKVTVRLLDTAPVVAADSSQLTSDGSGAAGVQFEAVPTGAFEMFSFAASGMFSITVQHQDGTSSTTSDLDYNASPAAISAALNALPGVSVHVSGLGTLSSPWLVSGVTLDSVTLNSSLLRESGRNANMLVSEKMTTVYRVWTEHTSGGTFALTLHAAGQDVTTGALDFNVSADDFNAALRNLSGMTSQVSGSGTQADPWVLVTGSQPIKTGDPLVFHDNWGMSGMGMIDGRTYYAVVGQQGIDPEEISLQLAATAADSNAATPVLMEMRPYLPMVPALSASFSGSPVVLSSEAGSDDPSGITIKADLDSSTSVGSYANLGGFPLLAYFVHGGWGIWKKEENAGGTSEIEKAIQEKLGGVNEDLANKGEGVGAAAAQWVSNHVQVDIGPLAKLGASDTVTILSEINHSVGTLSNAGLLKTNTNEEKGSFGIAVALSYSNIWNTSKAVVSSDAIVTGAMGVDVQSHINYAPPSRFGLNDGISKGWKGAGEVFDDLLHAFELFIFGDLSFVPTFFNSAANVGVVGSQKKSDYLWTASFSYEIIHNNNLAQIADGAQINDASYTFDVFNPNTSSRNPSWITLSPEKNFVDIVAHTDVRQWGLAGQLYFSLPYLIHSKQQLGQGEGSKWTDSGRLDDWLGFRSSTKNAFGGSVSLFTMDGLTQALLGGADPDGHTPTHANTTVYYGSGDIDDDTKGLRIWADTRNGIVNVAQAAANSSGWGIEGSVAYVAMGEPHATPKPDDRRQKTYAKMISRNLPLNVLPIDDSDGDVNVKANDSSFGWAITGSIMIGQSKGIGLSGSIVELTRDVQASIGSQYNYQQDDTTKYYMDPYRTSVEPTQQSGSEIHTNGFLTVTSHVGGTIVPLSLVGSGAVRGRGGVKSLGGPAGGGSDYGANGGASEIEQVEQQLKNYKPNQIVGEDEPEVKACLNRLDELKSKVNGDVPAKGNEQVLADEGNGSEGDSEVIENGQNSKKGKWGFFVSGDFSVAFVTDQVYGYINLDGTITGNGLALPDDKKTISSGNSTTINPGAGSFALQWDKSNYWGETKDSTAGFAGSVAWASVDSDVQAVIDGTSVDSMAVKLEAENNKKIGTGAAGFQLDSPSGFDLQVAGSVVINSISNTTVATLRNSTLTDIGDLDIKAYAKDHIYGLAGTAQVSLAPFEGGTVVGVGMSAVWNDTNNTTTAEIVDCPSITQILGDIQVIAKDFTTSTANSFGTQIAVTDGSVVEIGGMWTTNLLFPNTTAQITSSNVTNTNQNPGTKMLVSSTLAPILESFAGYFAIGWSDSEKTGQVGVGAAVITTRIGNKQEQLNDPTDNYQTLAQISHSTINAYDTVDVYALTGDLNVDTSSYVPDQSESDLSDSSKDRFNIRSLAIAGGAQAGVAAVSVSAQGSFVSTKTQIATIAQVTDSASILQASGHATDLTVKAINQITAHTDSGGVSAAITFSGSVGIAFGGAVNQYNSFNRTEALVDGSTVDTRNATVSATLAPFLENIAFGVAISASTSTAIGDSGADVHLNQYDSAKAGISSSTVTTTGDVTVHAEDDSYLKTGSGSGTLSIGTGTVGIAVGEVFNIVRVRNDVLAWIGTKPASRSDDDNETSAPNVYTAGTTDSSIITVGGCLTIEALSGQTIKSTTTAVAVSGSGSVALAGSGADAKIHLSNIVRAGINDVANVTVTGDGWSDKKPGVWVNAEIQGVNSDDSVKDRRVYAVIGDIAAVLGQYGASIGLSFGQITNDDFVVAQIENSTVTIGSDASGSSIEVSASDSRYMETKIWVTSIAIAIGGAVAGGHSFIYSQPNVIAEVGHSSQIKPTNDAHRSDLSVTATGQESVHAGIFGGVVGLVAIGDFIAEADKHGIVGAVLGTVGTLNVNKLTVEAFGNHNLDANGWSLAGGALAISGDGHRLTYDEQIVAYAGGDIKVGNSTATLDTPPDTTTIVNAASDVSLKAWSSTQAYSNAGRKPDGDNHSGTFAFDALGFFKSTATYSPHISNQTQQLNLTYGGDLELLAQTDQARSSSRAVTASSSALGADFTKAFNTIKPSTTLTVQDTNLTAAANSSGTMSLRATNDINYDTYAYTFAIAALGGSGSRVFNDFEPTSTVFYSGNNTFASAGDVEVVSHNAWTRDPDSSDNSDGSDIYTTQGIGGGVVDWNAATVGSGITKNDDAEIVQYVGFDAGDNGEITGGTFTLTYLGKTTTALDYNAKADEVQAALENLSFSDPQGNVTTLKDKIKVDRINSSKEKFQWKLTFTEGFGFQQVSIDSTGVNHDKGTLKPIQSSSLPWSYNGSSTIDFGTSSTEIKALESSRPIDVTWLSTQSIDIQEVASQHIFGVFGKAYAKSTVALNVNNAITLDNANVFVRSGIDQFTIASGLDIDAKSTTHVNHPVLGGGTSQAVIVLNATNTYADKKYDDSNGEFGTQFMANTLRFLTGGTENEWKTIAQDFNPQINIQSYAKTTGHDAISSAVIYLDNQVLQNSTVTTTGDIVQDHTWDYSYSMQYTSINNQAGYQSQPAVSIPNSNSYIINNGHWTAGTPKLNLAVYDEGVSVNDTLFTWAALESPDSVIYQDISSYNSTSNFFNTFRVGRTQSIDAALGQVLDAESLNTFKANFQANSTTSKMVYLLQNLVQPQGSIRIVADGISGTGTMAAYSPKLSIVNNTSGWLILDGISSHTNQDAGKVILRDSSGNATTAPGMKIITDSEPDRNIDISVSQPSDDAKPFMILAGYFNSPSSNVTLTNDYGPIIDLAPIRAASVTINVPNSAFAAYTPDYYFGTGGNSQLAFEDAAKANALVLNRYSPPSNSPSNSQPFVPGLIERDGDLQFEAHYVEPAAADYVNGTHNSIIPILASGSSSTFASYLGGGITAAQIAIKAKTIDINAPLNVGRKEDLSVVLTQELGDTLRQYQTDYNHGIQTNPLYAISLEDDDSVQGFGNFVAANSADQTAITASQITLTDGSANMARAAWYKQPIAADDDFTISFTYQASGDKKADGMALVFQKEGTNAIGNSGGGLGYVDINAQKAAYQINIFNGNARTVGSNFVTTNTYGTYNSTGNVDFSSGHRIRVKLTYDASRQQVVEELTDLDNTDSSSNSYTNTYTGINLGQFGDSYVGFTGGSGGETSVQTVTDFKLSLHRIVNAKIPEVAATYDARTNQITLTPIALAQQIRVLLDGEIVSTVSGSQISLKGGLSGQGIENQTGIPLVLNNIDAGPGGATGTVEFRDTLTKINTRYVYASSGVVSVYTAPREHSYAASPDEVRNTQSVDFQPQPNTLYGSYQQQDIIYSVVDNTWNYGDVAASGFANFHTVNNATVFGNSTRLFLTTSGSTGEANAAWLREPIDMTRNFTVSFHYDCNCSSSDDPGNGIALALQTQGIDAVGAGGGGLGYSMIGGNKAAFMINLYQYHTDNPRPGVKFDSNENWGQSYEAPGTLSVFDPMDVQLSFIATSKKWSAKLTTSSGSYTYPTDLDLTNQFGPSPVYLGFTGSTGDKTASQAVSDFLLVYDPQPSQATSQTTPAESQLVHVVPSNQIKTIASVSGAYNTEALFASGATFASTGGFDQAGNAYDYAAVQSVLAQSSHDWNLGPQTGNNAWRALGQSLTVPSYSTPETGSYLNLLGSTSYGPQSGTFTLHYADGSIETWTQSFSDWWWHGTSELQSGESVQGSMTLANQSNGSQQAGNFRLYSYNYRLKDGTTLVSIDFPNNAHIVLFGVNVGGTEFVPAGSLTSVSASGPYNTEVLYATGTPFSSAEGFDQAGNAYDYAAVQAVLSKTWYAWNLGPQAENNAWRTEGQSLTVPAYAPNDTGSYLNLLGATSYGPQSGIFTLHYADGSTDTWTQSFSDWWSNGTSNLQPGESLQGSMTFVNQSNGSPLAGDIQLYSYSYRLKEGTTLLSIDLPNNSHIVLLGVSVSGTWSSDAISSEGITFSNSDNNRPRAVWYSDPISTDVDTLSVDFTYQATNTTATKISGFSHFIAQDSSYANAVTSNRITLTDGSDWVSRAAWYDTPIQTTDSFDLAFTYQSAEKAITGFNNFVNAGPHSASITANGVILTDNNENETSAVWLNDKVSVRDGFTLSFTYQAGGDKNGNGMALVFQTSGTTAVGGGGDKLGYTGIPGPKYGFLINLYNGSNHERGFQTTSEDTFDNTQFRIADNLNWSNGDAIQVELKYSTVAPYYGGNTWLYIRMTNLSNNKQTNFNRIINLESHLGASDVYLGFTGSSGAAKATQVVSNFSFQPNQADGMALVFQNQGTNAKGSNDGGLGYVGIEGAKAAYQINLYTILEDSVYDTRKSGSNFVTNDTSGIYNTTGTVNLASGNPIQVRLSYDSQSHQLTENLYDTITRARHAKTYYNIDLENLLGSTAYLGFTGSSGAMSAVQTVTDFSFESHPDDGLALVFQSAGTNAFGTGTHGLGYVGISGPTAAYQIHLTGDGAKGSNLVTTNTAGVYHSTGSVDLASGHPIHVQLLYDRNSRQLTETLTDLISNATYSHRYDFDLSSAVGPYAYLGFTAPRGGAQTRQSIKDFHFSATSSSRVDFKQHFAAHPLSKSINTNPITSYSTDLSTWLRADHPIRVDFSGITSDELKVVSNAALTLNGLIRVVDTASLTTTNGSIFATSTGSVTARTVNLMANGDDDATIGTATSPVNIKLTNAQAQSGFVSASGISGVYLASPGDLSIRYVSTVSPTDSHDGPVVIHASGDIVPYSSTSLIYAGKLSMTSGGAIGSIANPLQVQLASNVVLDGSTVAGLLSAQATDDISIYHYGDVRIGKVKTPGTVAITTHSGSILDGLTLDALGLNDPNLSPKMRKQLLDFFKEPEPDLSDESIVSLEASVNAMYLQYWQLIPVLNFPVQPPLWNTWDPGDWGAIVTITDSDGNPQQVYQLTAEGIEAFRPKAALDYQEDNPTDSEVQDYANSIWQSCVKTFASTDAFGPNWESLPQFQHYDPAYQFTASEETVANIKASFQESFNLFSYLSSAALANPKDAAAIAKLANIEAGNLILSSSGSIGEDRAAVDIPLEHFQNKTLTAEELQLVRFASQAGEIQLIGKNTAGETIYYDASSPPDSVTLTGVRVKISRPLLVQLAANGSLTATSGSELLVASTSGDLNIKSANSTSKGFVWLESAEGLLVADGTTGTTVTGGAIRLGAGQAIGTSAEPLIVSASGKVDLASLADASLKSSSPLEIGQWNVAGALNLIVDGSGAVTDALASNRGSFAGFGGNGAGWTADTTHGSAAVTSTATDDVLNVSLDAGASSSSTWPSQVVFAKNDPVHLSNHFALGFLYQSSAIGSRVALNLGNTDQQGLALVLNLGSADGTDAWADFVTTSEITTATSGQSIGSVLLNSDHPIQVTITYSMLTQTVVASLIDTVTKQAIAIEKTGVNLTQRLGSAAATIDWTVLGDGATPSTHAIRGFRLIDGSANFVANTLNVVVGGEFGTVASSSTNQPENPILLLIDGKTQITAGGAIVAEQVVGDLEVGVISSPTTIEVSAPFGMIVQAPSGGSGGEGETTLQGVMGPNVSIAALLGVGTADGKLMVTTDHLSATTSMNDLELQHQSHTENGVAEIANLIAGGTVRLRTNSDVSVTGRVIGQSAEFHSYYPGKAIRLALKDLEHILGGSLGIVLGGFESLQLDDTQASEAHAIQVSSGIVESHTAKITTGVVRTLAMSLGLGDDKVSVLDASGLSALSIDGQDGHDSVSLANAALAISQVHFNGSLGDDALNVDLRNTGVWITKGKLETAYGVIQYHDLAKFILNRLEEPGHPEAIEKIEQIAEEFPDDRLMVVGTIGMDFLAMNSLSSDILLQANWNAQTSERRTYSKSRIRDVQIYLLGGDDSISVIGTVPVALDIHGGMGNDWIFVQSLSATITDMHGDNVITTGPSDDVIHTGTGNDQIDAGSGKNQIQDDGGLNAITTGDDDDKIWHANAEDWIIAQAGSNDIWLQGVHQDWHNESNPLDVNRDGVVNSTDILVVINRILQKGPHYLQGSVDSVQFCYDVSGNNYIDPMDILRIINWMIRNDTAEGESSLDAHASWNPVHSDRLPESDSPRNLLTFKGYSAPPTVTFDARESGNVNLENEEYRNCFPIVSEVRKGSKILESYHGIDWLAGSTFDNPRRSSVKYHDDVFAEWHSQEWSILELSHAKEDQDVDDISKII